MATSTPQKRRLAYRNEYGVDGIMIGRGSIGNPWIFDEIKHFFATGEHLAAPDSFRPGGGSSGPPGA